MRKLILLSMLLLFFFTGCGECEHQYDSGKITKEPTCTDEGETTYTCSLCGETQIERIEKAAHVYEDKVTKESTFDEEGVKTFTCAGCGDSYTEAIPVLEAEVVVTVTDKVNVPKDTRSGRYSDRVELTFDVKNMTDKTVKGVQGSLTVSDLFGKDILVINCDFTGNTIEANSSITVSDLGMDINQFMDKHIKFYNEKFSDLIFKYEVSNVVYGDGSSTVELEKDTLENQKVAVHVTDKKNLEKNLDAGRYSPRVEFTFDVCNNTSKDIKGIQGILTIKDLFGVDIMSVSLDFTGQTIGANKNVIVSDLGIDINQFKDDHVQLYNTNLSDLKFEYEVTAIVYSDGTTE